MDALRSHRYIIAIVRLLLLLSALLSALTGMATGRAQAQPAVAARVAGGLVAEAGAGFVRPASLRVAVESPVRLSPAVLPPMPRLVSAAVSRRLFAERRRE